MAHPVWRRKTRKVYVYYIDPVTNRLSQLPRSETLHLDGKPKEDVLTWVASWEEQHGVARHRVEKISLRETDKLLNLWKQYQTHQNLNRSRRQNTAIGENEVFMNHIVPYFVGVKKLKLPAQWHPFLPDFQTYLFEKKLSVSMMQKILWTLERFSKHLVWTRYMEYPFTVQIPREGNTKITPLKARKSPAEIIKYVKGSNNYKNEKIDFDLAILLGYFAALGPGELFALDKSDLLTGKEAEKHARTLEGFRKNGLGSKLAIIVNKTLPSKGRKSQPVHLMKNDFRASVVTIWSADAAKLIADLVRNKPDGRLFPYSYGHLFRMWRENVGPALRVTSHDLRRASCLYLGRTARLELTLLQEHMRHAEIETTMLYCREPATPEKSNRKVVQDFDDVV